jgi:hypothetical protein
VAERDAWMKEFVLRGCSQVAELLELPKLRRLAEGLLDASQERMR